MEKYWASRNTKYYESRKTASRKILKAFGLDGIIPKDEEIGTLSHRERAKYK